MFRLDPEVYKRAAEHVFSGAIVDARLVYVAEPG